MDIRRSSLCAVLFFIVAAAWSAWLWQPARQVRLHEQNFLKAYEGRNWQKVSGFLADDYADRWGHNKEFVVSASREVFSQFIILGVAGQTVSCTVAEGTGEISTRIQIQGQGGPLAQLVLERVNGLHEPFLFTWVRQSWKPWDWKLARADQSELVLEMPNL